MANLSKALSLCLMIILLFCHVWISLRAAFSSRNNDDGIDHSLLDMPVETVIQVLRFDDSKQIDKTSSMVSQQMRRDHPRTSDGTTTHGKPTTRTNNQTNVQVILEADGKKLQCLNLIEICKKHNSSRPMMPDTAPDRKTLALGDPWFRGGFRNQQIRFTSFLAKSLILNSSDILLPSLKYYGSGSQKGANAVPFDLLYDVNHWNEAVDRGDSFLPKLVPYDATDHYQWDPQTTLYYEFCDMIERYAYKPPFTDYSTRFAALRHPRPHGGGFSTGILWDEYRKQYDKRGYIKLPNLTTLPIETLDRLLSQVLRPSPTMKALMDKIHKHDKAYLALHARFEPEMIVHGLCLDIKVRQLPPVLEQISQYPDFEELDSMFVAVSMPQMLAKYRRKKYRDVHEANLAALLGALDNGLKKKNGGTMDVWTAGEKAVEEWVDDCMLMLVSSFVNFEIAVEAAAFVGTATSTWSIAVWKERYHRGLPNYAFVPSGIIKVEGRPESFRC